MRYLCLGYGDRAKMEAVPAPEMKAILRTCASSVRELNQFSGMILHHALSWDVTTLRASDGEVAVIDEPYAATREQIGSFFVIEARDLNEAIRLASEIPMARHGSIEVRPVRELPSPRRTRCDSCS